MPETGTDDRAADRERVLHLPISQLTPEDMDLLTVQEQRWVADQRAWLRAQAEGR
jgi:hypothetical protein